LVAQPVTGLAFTGLSLTAAYSVLQAFLLQSSFITLHYVPFTAYRAR
jgi:hypothetical protein